MALRSSRNSNQREWLEQRGLWLREPCDVPANDDVVLDVGSYLLKEHRWTQE